MKLIIWLTLCFMSFELLKLLMPKTYWNASLKRAERPLLALVEITYFIFLVGLFFVHYWYIGLAVLIVSIITAFQVMDDAMEKTKFNKQIKSYLLVDGIVSILMLSVILLKEFQIL